MCQSISCLHPEQWWRRGDPCASPSVVSSGGRFAGEDPCASSPSSRTVVVGLLKRRSMCLSIGCLY